ncbi:hypothetical protein [Marinomonas colpomeniae]|uniref:Uncharacterized protein n=1 Tax=Marinomonas colpomeniae TaxID=2774408 RepID=A0ABR8NW76_9GAMM|nr:hypothetical protein [Marinomonas colpomeniae]MBD5770158.1 hypothetical protein [Marinomonas colpomeniae]
MDERLKEPWKLDTNNKYSEVIKSVFGLATASLLLPVFMARSFLDISSEKPLSEIFSGSIYLAWLSFGVAILSCVFYQYLSAKWVRIAWGKKAGIFWSSDTKEDKLECCMEFSFWLSVLFFIAGLGFTIYYFTRYSSGL